MAEKNFKQKTLKSEVCLSGRGLFTGQNVSLQILPLPENSKILFQRMDLPACPVIPASLEYVFQSVRCTTLKKADATIQTVEHLLSALHGLGIHNALIRVHGPEIPIGDGSSSIFIDAIEKAGILEQDAEEVLYSIKKPLYFSENGAHLIALPSDQFVIHYNLHYPQSSLLRSQACSIILTPDSFKKEISCSRTFSLYEDIEALLKKGMLNGGGLENGIVIKEDKVLNPEGLRSSNEMACHKVLDLIGDLSLIGKSFAAQIIAIRSGHMANVSFARQLIKQLKVGV